MHTNSFTHRAFTLVELIVVVTILAILATIGFVSYSGYLTGVRDTNRIASLTSISDGLELYRTKNDLPLPDNNVEVQVEDDTIARQGYAGSNVLQTIEYSKAGKDPKDDQYYSYYLTDDKKHYQMMAFLEESDNLESRLNHSTQPHPQSLSFGGEGSSPTLFSNYSPLMEGVGGVTFAATDYSNRHPKVYGKRLGILTDADNTPIQEISTITTIGNLNMTGGTTTLYKARFTDSDIMEGTGSTLLYMGEKSSCRRIKQLRGSASDGVYTIDPTGTSTMRVYCDMTKDGGGWMLVAGIDGSSRNHVNILAVTDINLLGKNGKGKYSDSFIQSFYKKDGYRLECDAGSGEESYILKQPTCNFASNAQGTDCMVETSNNYGVQVVGKSTPGQETLSYADNTNNGCGDTQAWSGNGRLWIK